MKRSHAITLGLCLILLFAGWTGGLAWTGWTQPAQAACTILVLAAILWMTEIIPLFATSILVLILGLIWLVPALREQGLAATNQMLLAPFFSDIILLFLGGFVLSAALHKYRLDERAARKVIELTGHSFAGLLLGVMGVTAFLSMWLSNTATAAMMLSLVLPLAGRLPENHSGRRGLILAVPLAANVGGLGTPIGSPPNAIAMQYMKSLGNAPVFAEWMLVGIPGVVGMVLVAWGILWRLHGRGHPPLTTDQLDSQASVLPPIKGSALVVLIGMALTVLGWLTIGWHGYSSGTVALFPVFMFFATGMLRVQDLRALSWDILLLMGGGLCLGTILTESGLASALVSSIPLSGASTYGLMVLLGTMACVLSSFMSNTATANLLMPIILGLGVASQSFLLLGVAFACSLAMPLPVSTPPNAIAFSSGQLSSRDLLIPGLIVTVLGMLLTFTVGYAWWQWVGIARDSL